MDDFTPISARLKPHVPRIPDGEPMAPRRQPKSSRVQPPKNDIPSKRGRGRILTNRKATPISPIIVNAPASPNDVLQRYATLLTEYEKKEISSFPDIYFLGNKSRKIIPSMRNQLNYGFDDEDHNYKLIVGDHLAYRFEVMTLFGAGAFGQVARCFDHKIKQPVAVKIIVNTDQMHEQGQIEAKVLAKLNRLNPRHIVRAYDFFIFRSHICITFEILGMNLYELSEINNFRPIPIRLARLYSIQSFTALEQIHKIGAIHCDIKPENILLVSGSNSLVKIIDFGSACFDGHQKYEHIQSRFYRAPEVLLGLPYGSPMDIWSMALVIIELLLGRPIFPGEDELEQLWYIVELIGLPPPELVERGKRSNEFFDEEGNLREDGLPRKFIPSSIDLGKLLNTRDTQLVDFLMRCLTWDQYDRMTALQALSHPWVRMKEFQLNPVARNSHKTLPEIKDIIKK